MGMKCKCGGEIDLTTGQCKKCKIQCIRMSGNASIITEADGNTTELISKKKNNKENNIKFNIK